MIRKERISCSTIIWPLRIESVTGRWRCWPSVARTSDIHTAECCHRKPFLPVCACSIFSVCIRNWWGEVYRRVAPLVSDIPRKLWRWSLRFISNHIKVKEFYCDYFLHRWLNGEWFYWLEFDIHNVCVSEKSENIYKIYSWPRYR